MESEGDPRYSNYLLAIKLMIESRPLQELKATDT